MRYSVKLFLVLLLLLLVDSLLLSLWTYANCQNHLFSYFLIYYLACGAFLHTVYCDHHFNKVSDPSNGPTSPPLHSRYPQQVTMPVLLMVKW